MCKINIGFYYHVHAVKVYFFYSANGAESEKIFRTVPVYFRRLPVTDDTLPAYRNNSGFCFSEYFYGGVLFSHGEKK